MQYVEPQIWAKKAKAITHITTSNVTFEVVINGRHKYDFDEKKNVSCSQTNLFVEVLRLN